jgi:hypothetical protein
MSAAAIIASIWFGISNRSLTESYHNETKQATASDEHIGKLIDDKLNPAQAATSQKLGNIEQQLARLSQQLGQVQGTLHIYTQAQDKLQSTVDQQIELAKLTQPRKLEQALAVIRAEIGTARSSKQPIPLAKIAEYKNAVRIFPDSLSDYWKTVAAIINYQSLLDQENGSAPNPKTVAHLCAGLSRETGKNNIFQNLTISKCIVDLDGANVLENVTIRSSVIRYHGGPVTLHNAVLMNCYFELDLKAPPNPSQSQFLRAILDAPEQKTIALPNIHPS